MFGGTHRRARREAFSAARQASLATIDESTEAHNEALMPHLSQLVAELYNVIVRSSGGSSSSEEVTSVPSESNSVPSLSPYSNIALDGANC